MISQLEYELFALDQQDRISIMEIQYQLVNEGTISNLVSSFVNFISGLIERIVKFITHPFSKKNGLSAKGAPVSTFKCKVKVPVIVPSKAFETAQSMVNDGMHLSQKLSTTGFNETDNAAYDKIAALLEDSGRIFSSIFGVGKEEIYQEKVVSAQDLCDMSSQLNQYNDKLVPIEKNYQRVLTQMMNKAKSSVADEEKAKTIIDKGTALSKYITLVLSTINIGLVQCTRIVAASADAIEKAFNEKYPDKKGQLLIVHYDPEKAGGNQS